MALCLSYGLGTTYFVKDFTLSYPLGVISFIFSVLYVVQFLFYTHRYIKISTKNVTYKKGLNPLVRSIASATTLKKAAIVCLECVKTVLPFVLGVELTWKLTNGDMNEISQWRQAILNDMFPEDLTKDWTESKAESATHNRAMGYFHETVYKPGDVLPESSNSKKK
jgi:hypothetical protein